MLVSIVLFCLSLNYTCMAQPNTDDSSRRVGVAAGGCDITSSAKNKLRTEEFQSIEKKISQQTGYTDLVKKFDKQHLSCVITLKAIPGGHFQIADLKLKKSASKDLDERFFELLRRAAPFENPRSIWNLKILLQFPKLKVVECGAEP